MLKVSKEKWISPSQQEYFFLKTVTWLLKIIHRAWPEQLYKGSIFILFKHAELFIYSRLRGVCTQRIWNVNIEGSVNVS